MKKIFLWSVMCLTLVFISSVTAWAGAREKVPFRAEVYSGYEEDSVKARCDATDLQPIEGIWYYPDKKMKVVIERCNDDATEFRLVLVSADDVYLLPGTVIGFCELSADKNKYRMWLYSEQNTDKLENPQLCLATLNSSNDVLIVERSETKLKVRVNFARFLPKIFKGISIVPEVKTVDVPEGFRKIYPGVLDGNKQIIYL